MQASIIIDIGLAYVLLFFFGCMGAHRFYLRRWGTGLLYLCTLGLLGVGVIWDVFMIPRMARRLNGVEAP